MGKALFMQISFYENIPLSDMYWISIGRFSVKIHFDQVVVQPPRTFDKLVEYLDM